MPGICPEANRAQHTSVPADTGALLSHEAGQIAQLVSSTQLSEV